MNETDLLKDTMAMLRWPQVKALAERDALVLLPVGIIEEHSRHLPLCTDIAISVAQARLVKTELEKRVFPCVIAPPLYWGIATGASGCLPGTFSVREETVVMLLTDVLTQLERMGFSRVIVFNAHGDPTHRKAYVRALREYAQDDTHTLSARWFTFEDDMAWEGFDGTEPYVMALPAIPEDVCCTMDQEMRDGFDVHAGAFETAQMLELFPTLTDTAIADTLKPTMLDREGIRKWNSGVPEDAAEVIPDGHAGDPAFYRNIHFHSEAFHALVAQRVVAFYQKH